MQKKIVLTGGPGTGKSSILDEFKARGFSCMPEISREVTQKAQKKGIQQLFLSDPLLFSNLLFEGREHQFKQAQQSNGHWIFFDRGIRDVYDYLDYTDFNYGTGQLMLKEKNMKKVYKFNENFNLTKEQKIYKMGKMMQKQFEKHIALKKKQQNEINKVLNQYKQYKNDRIKNEYENTLQQFCIS